jgi:hypothetical protein
MINKKQPIIKDCGLRMGLLLFIYSKQEMNMSCDKNMQNLKDELDIIAFGLRSFRDSKGDEIKKKVEKGLKIRILTCDPKSPFLKQREKDEK